jgi:hypothetical protein
MSVFEYTIKIFCYIWELSHLQSLASHSLCLSDADTLWNVPECTTVDKLRASVQTQQPLRTRRHFPEHMCIHIYHIRLNTAVYEAHYGVVSHSVIAFRSAPRTLYPFSQISINVPVDVILSVPSFVSRTSDGCSTMLSALHLHGCSTMLPVLHLNG